MVSMSQGRILSRCFCQSDYQRLKKLSQPELKQPAGEILLTAATHRISWPGDHEAVLQSDLELRRTLGTTATVWRVPIKGIHEISATLDGRPAPVMIEEEGQQAAIPIPGPGRFRIHFRGSKSAIKDGTSESIDFPINPMPSASLVVDRPPRPIRFLSVRGGTRTQADQSIAAELGPTNRVELRWGDPELSPAPASGTVESLLLWDIEPAGDRLRGRFTYHGQRRLPALCLSRQPRYRSSLDQHSRHGKRLMERQQREAALDRVDGPPASGSADDRA